MIVDTESCELGSWVASPFTVLDMQSAVNIGHDVSQTLYDVGNNVALETPWGAQCTM